MANYEAGAEIASYRIESLIGRSAMSAVYRAEDMRLSRTVAIKLLSPQLAGIEGVRRRLIMESQRVATLNHPNIIPIYDVGEVDDQLFIAMRYIEGGDLRGLLLANGPLSIARTLRLLGQIGDALDFAHRAGLVHRDVSPANILIEADPPTRSLAGEHCFLTNFGHGIVSIGSEDERISTGYHLGTIDYISPEQIQGRTVGPAADIYAMGCIFHECLTGRPPFPRDDDAALLWAHLVEAPPLITEHRREIPSSIDAVVTRAMAKDPDDRYESCAEFARAVKVALDEAPTASSPRGSFVRPSDQVDSYPWAPRSGRELDAHVSSDVARDEGEAAPVCAAPADPAEPELDERPALHPRPARSIPATDAPRSARGKSLRRPRLAGTATPSHSRRNIARKHFSLGDMDNNVKRIVSPGRIILDAPEHMRLGQVERVVVGIARRREMDEALRATVLRPEHGRIEDIDTSPLMGVELRGRNFEITSLSTPDSEQLLSPIAHWEFDVLPLRSGMQKLQLVVWMEIVLPNRPQGRRSAPVLEWEVQVRVAPIYEMKQFVGRNWQWLAGSLMAAGGGLTAWLKLVG